MSSIQERLQLKRVPIDKWSIREQLCLASAVLASGDQNWMSVSRAVKMLCGTDRPSDWFSQKSCAAQYGKLLENVETPKRKKRTEKDNIQTPVETPGESIVRKLQQERIEELNQLIQDDRQEYLRRKDEILLVQSGNASEAQLEEMWSRIEIEKKQREKEQQQHAQWLKEREERKIEMERAWRPIASILTPGHSPMKVPPLNIKIKSEDNENDEFNIKQGTSPLLTSLLKSPSPAPNSCNTVLHPSINQSTNATRVSAPTITNLLTGNIPNISAHIHTAAGNLSSITSTASVANSSFPMHLSKQPLSGVGPSIDPNTPTIVSPSQAAPTLSMLLENKKDSTGQRIPPLVRIEPQPKINIDHVPRCDPIHVADARTEPPIPAESVKIESVDSPSKEDDQHLMEVFNGMIPDNIDELADILTDNNAIILNSELLEEESMLENVESLINDENPSIKSEENSNQQSIEMLEHSGPVCIDDTTRDGGGTSSSMDKDAMKQDESNDSSSPRQLDSIVLIRDDENSDISNDIPLAKLIPQKSSSAKSDDNTTIRKEEPDCFESDSNDDKCLESIKREIRSLSGLKETNSDNSNEGLERLETIPEHCKEEEEQDGKNEPSTTVDANVKMEIDEPYDEEQILMKEEHLDLPEIDEVLEIKSDDGKSEAVIIIEETDDGNSEENTSDDVKRDTESQKIEDVQIKHRKTSSDDEIFEDAKEHLDIAETSIALDQKTNNDDNTITIIDTDDDSEIKDEKLPKSKRDYSRKKDSDKRSEEGTTSDDSKTSVSTRMKLKERERSESPYIEDDGTECIPRSRRRYSSTPNIDSLPNSPASSDDREYRAWKKSILIVYNRLSNHKYSSHFMKPISEDQSSLVYRPMDLQTIKKNIETGLTRTTMEFQRDVALMCLNAILLNQKDSTLRSIAEEFLNYALNFIESTMDSWKKESEKSSSTTSSSGCGGSGGGGSGGGGSAGNTKLMRGRKSPRLLIV